MCPAGKYSPGGPSTAVCTNCTAGTYCPSVGASSPVSCPPGKYTDTAGQTACKACDMGFYSDAPGSNSSTCAGRCSAGYYCTGGSIAACPPGTYSIPGLYFCLVCPAGRFGNVSALSSPECSGPCATPGTYCPTGSTSPNGVLCPPGTYSISNATACTACPSSTPYSRAGSTSSAACVQCTSTNCTNGLLGAYPCPDASWTAWVNVGGVEASHSCIKAFPIALNWSVANATCAGLGPGYHLLTTRQVGRGVCYTAAH